MLTKNQSNAEQQYSCDVCSEAITNPICPVCLATEIEAWLTFYPDLREGIYPKIGRYLKKIKEKIEDSTQCIKCGNKIASVCPFCFTDFVLDELHQMKANKILLKEFVGFFNFRNQIPSPHAEKWGYSQVI